MTTYSVIGLGKLGASMAAAVAKRGFDVIGVDVNQQAVEQINAGHAPVQETDLEETICANKERLRATLSTGEAVLGSNVSFVIVPTPSDERGAFMLKYVGRAFREIGRALAAKDDYHLVVLTSTVLPGSTRYGLLPILERESGKAAGQAFGLCYSPEFIALGSVIRDFLNPDFTLVGELDEQSGSLLEACYGEIMENDPPCKRMSLENAELAKIAVNTFVTTKITFANMLADLCERLPGGDVDVVTDALGTDRRIGHRYLKGALGYGGPCFPRDNVALAYIARELGTRARLAEVTDSENRALPDRVMERLRPVAGKGATVAVLGLAYKPASDVIEESQGVDLAELLSGAGANVVVYDPLAGEIARDELAGHAVVLESVDSCLEQADVVLVTTPDPVFAAVKSGQLKRDHVIVVDFWRILERELSGKPGISYVPVGRAADDAASAARLEELWGDTAETLE
jgi:UDPglucose 6-dehydrogenase